MKKTGYDNIFVYAKKAILFLVPLALTNLGVCETHFFVFVLFQILV